MRDGNDGHRPDSAADVRRAMRPAPRRRFYATAATAPVAGGHAVSIDTIDG